MSGKTDAIARMEAVVKRTERFLPFFGHEQYKEWSEILEKKIAGYQYQLEHGPSVGDIEYMDQEQYSAGTRIVTRVPYRVTKEEKDAVEDDIKSRIRELRSIIDMPKLMAADSARMKAELLKLSGEEGSEQ